MKKLALIGAAMVAVPVVFARNAPGVIYAAFGGNCIIGEEGQWICGPAAQAGTTAIVVLILAGIGIYLWQRRNKR